MVADISVDITTLFVLLAMFCVLADEHILVEGGCTCRYGGRSTGYGWSDEGGFTDEHILCCRQENPGVGVLAPSVGTLN